MTTANYLRAEPKFAGSFMNDIFDEMGLGRPINGFDVDGQLTVLMIGDKIGGAAYAAAASSVAETLSVNGRELHQALVAGSSLQALVAVGVREEYRGRGYGTELLHSIFGHARRDLDADYVLAHIDVRNHRLRRWFRDLGFTICTTDETLKVDGVLIPGREGFLDSWYGLNENPRVRLTRSRGREVKN